MKAIFAALVLLTTAAAATLTSTERENGVAELEGSKKMFLDATAGLSAAQWSFKSAPERWSIAECAEHIALSEAYIFGFVSERIVKGPATPEKRELAKGKDELILKILQDRSHKATAPEALDPTKKPMPAEDAVKLFLANRAKTIDFIQTTQEDLRDHFYDHPVQAFGTMDAYQWILFISGHTRRHTLQILEVKADPNFPKN
ncbi:MAG TPA: DinB family protein [Methylomirabilota bacterium]|jgi:hypothetical protein|nr:DinB family protein [Methylomirabilota bacterium]